MGIAALSPLESPEITDGYFRTTGTLPLLYLDPRYGIAIPINLRYAMKLSAGRNRQGPHHSKKTVILSGQRAKLNGEFAEQEKT